MPGRIPCRAVFLDAGGVLVLPRRDLVARALADAGPVIDPGAVPGAHYAATSRIDAGESVDYFELLCQELGVPRRSIPMAAERLAWLGDRRRSGEILWSEPTPRALPTINALTRSGIAVIVVSNSDGHAEDNLRAAAVCQPGPGPGAAVRAVVDSTLVGIEKPDPGIFEIALRTSGTTRNHVVHVGDMISTDIAGAHAAGIVAVHLDPGRRCRRGDHRHVRALTGIWQHVVAAGAPVAEERPPDL